MPRLLTIMGSGETAPTMVKAHREVFARLGLDTPRAVVLDTPYGFQTNADIVSEKAVAYFRESVGRQVEVAGLRRTDTVERVELERALARVAAADWLFTGPGSPSFALRQWRGTPVPDVLAQKLTEQGALVFSSAAALTLGLATVPVYEIYKVGADPYWLDGLDLLSRHGLPVAVIPHFDNTEGGNHDTRFCYLGLSGSSGSSRSCRPTRSSSASTSTRRSYWISTPTPRPSSAGAPSRCAAANASGCWPPARPCPSTCCARAPPMSP